MATIDTSTIEGFDSMTAEQKVDALTKFNIPDSVDMSKYVEKTLFDKTSSELADAKKTLKSKMTAEETAAAEAAKKQEELENKYNELLKSSTIANHTAKYLEMGYSAELAKATAEALFDGDMEKVFANQQKANEERDKRVKAELMRDNPRPDGSGGDGDKDPNIELAKKIGKAKADNAKAYEDRMKRFY
jgi:hypothetical protein